MSRLTYRPEIDGLRAVAVLAVLFFHSQLKFPGGYVGVDIFFVISGYLITGLILADLRAGTFSFREFWERRIRRIVPAAAATVLGCLVVGFVLMLPTDFEELGRSAVAQALLVANVFFYYATDYFGGPADTKPLLHFWSLAVEEQFYLFFPFLLTALYRWKRTVILPVIGALAAASLAWSAVGVAHFPSATFYLLPSRIWELAVGALLAVNRGQLPLPERTRGIFGWAGVALMLAPMFLYDEGTPFPGLAALPPCIGTALVIWATAGSEGILKRLLSWRPVVFVGAISYSLYLCHWPVKVFTQYWFTGLYSPLWMRLAIVPLSFVLAWLSWRYVETPFRTRRRQLLSRRIFGGAALAGMATFLAGASIAENKGLPTRFPAQVARYDAAYHDRPEIEEADLTTEAAERGDIPVVARGHGEESILIWGDSHARVASPAVESACGQLNVTAFRASRSETAPLLDWKNDDIRRHNAAVFRWVEQHHPTIVLLVARWERVLRSPADEASLTSTVAALEATGVEVALMRQVPSQRRDVPKSLARAALLGDAPQSVGVRVKDHNMFTRRSNEIIDRVARKNPLLKVLDPVPYLSRAGHCFAEQDGRPVYYDYQHLTRFGAQFLTPLFANLLTDVVHDPERRIAYPPAASLSKTLF
jgi:peptidoglycan/LPS O-acetylase OafA/YrhL